MYILLSRERVSYPHGFLFHYIASVRELQCKIFSIANKRYLNAHIMHNCDKLSFFIENICNTNSKI